MKVAGISQVLTTNRSQCPAGFFNYLVFIKFYLFQVLKHSTVLNDPKIENGW